MTRHGFALAFVVSLVLAAVACAQGPQYVTVPHKLSASALLREVREDLKPSYVDQKYGEYVSDALVRDVRGRSYRVATWRPGQDVTSDEVRDHFTKLGFSGNTPAFLEWARQDTADGWFATVPDKLFCQTVDDETRCFAPYLHRRGSYSTLLLRYADVLWPADTVFVAFREIRRQ